MSLADALGTCPDCGTPIPTTRVLIEYQRNDGPAVYAECPDCREVVHPA
jgi:hypothetical protein